MLSPTAQTKPKIAFWRYQRSLSLRGMAQLINAAALSAGLVRPEVKICSHEMVRTMCLPFGDPERSTPKGLLLQAIEVLTDGEVTDADFSAPVAAAA